MPFKTADEIAQSQRSDLYFGVAAPIGVRRDSFEAELRRTLAPYGYEVELIRVSSLLTDFKEISIDSSSEDSRLRSSMDAGSSIRSSVSKDALARAVMLDIASRRPSRTKPTAYVIWSLKHPEEVASLRLVYGGSFHLIALFASESERIAELQRNPGINDKEAREHVARDKQEPGKTHGQQTRETFHRADVFLPWGSTSRPAPLDRFMKLIFGHPGITPTADEHHMFLAFSSALRSGDLSRQVGAALVSSSGDVLAVGANDVPRCGGGLYWPSDGDDRDIARGEDWNMRVRRELLTEIATTIDPEAKEDLIAKLEHTKLRDITEYGRAVHAEMEALLACGRTGRSTSQAILYTTTFPCHNCARHIIGAGISRVVYVEPYPKSRAMELHSKDILEVEPGGQADDDRVRFEPYLGVGPRRFFDYFSMALSSGYQLRRKRDDGKLSPWNPETAAPRVQLPMLPLQEFEKSLGTELLPFQCGEE
ncbi:MAG: cytidine deaminase [Planctomycetes bacterium]|nr:cytidine deaminase [Planctomycetota bacterium]